MRKLILFLLTPCLAACMPNPLPAPYGLALNPPPAPYAQAPSLPYPACGDMAALRANVTGTPWETPQTDAELRRLGVRCVGEPYPAAGVVRARY